MASLSVSAWRKTPAIRGMATLETWRMPRTGLPASLAPRLCWARRMSCISATSWGTKRKAMPAIMPNSCAGTPKRASGEISASRASVRSSVGVTIVTRAIPNIMSVMRAAVSAAACRLPVLTSMMPQLTSVVPPCCVKSLSRETSTTMPSVGARARSALAGVMRAHAYRETMATSEGRSPVKSRACSTSTRNATPSRSFVRGSRRWSAEVPAT